METMDFDYVIDPIWGMIEKKCSNVHTIKIQGNFINLKGLKEVEMWGVPNLSKKRVTTFIENN